MALFSLYASRDGHPVGAPSSIALFFRGCAARILAAKGRREAPSPASVPWIRRKDESWAADRSRRRFATIDNDRACTTVKFRSWWARHYQEWHARSARYSANAFLSIEGPRVGWNSEFRIPNSSSLHIKPLEPRRVIGPVPGEHLLDELFLVRHHHRVVHLVEMHPQSIVR